jgi:hypothetical protein
LRGSTMPEVPACAGTTHAQLGTSSNLCPRRAALRRRHGKEALP